MKKILVMPLCTIILSGCGFFSSQPQSTTSTPADTTIKEERSYDEVKDKMILWNDIFNQPETIYYVYLFSLTCSHCNEFKPKILDYVKQTTKTFYFVQESNQFQYVDDASKTINATSCDDFAIVGFPSLAVINNHKVVKNIAGVKPIEQTLNL